MKRIAVLLVAALLGGCVVVPYDSGYRYRDGYYHHHDYPGYGYSGYPRYYGYGYYGFSYRDHGG